jgi:ABC-type transport system substrate-binding protein
MEERMNDRTFRWQRYSLGALLVLALALSGSHTAFAGKSGAGKTNTFKKSGTVRYSDWEFPDTLNTFQTGLGVTQLTLNMVLAQPLIIDNKAKLAPDLLENVPSAKNGELLNKGKTIILKLKPGQYWSSGVEITNKDLLFGWQMYMDPVTGPACLGSCDHIASIKLVGKYEAILKLKDSYAPILSVGLPPVFPHNWPALGLNPHDAATKLSQDAKFNYEDNTYWTDGPYQVAEFVANDRITLKPMKYYHVHPGPHVATFIFEFYASKDGEIAAAGSGQTDVSTDYTYADVPSLKQHTDQYKLYVTPSFVAEHLEYNCLDTTYNGKPNPLHDIRVRQALNLAIDKISLIRSALGLDTKTANSIVAYTPLTVTPTLVQEFGDKALKGNWDPIAKKFLPYSARTVRDAKTLLEQAGYPGGFSLDFLTTAGNPTRAAEYGVIAKNWNDIGVQATLLTSPASQFASDWDHNGPRNHGAFQVSLWAFGNAPDPDNLHTYFESAFIDRNQSKHSAINVNYSGIQDPIIDHALQKGATSFDPKVRAKWYTIFQEELNKGAYWTVLYYRANIATVDGHVTGATGYPGGGYFGNTWNPWAWSTKGG